MLFSSDAAIPKSNNSLQLSVETLESRILLSTVQVFAAGQTGQEAFQVKIDDVVQAEFHNVGGNLEAREFEVFTFETPENISAGQVRLEFFNDLYDPANGIDRNLLIDKIVVDGVTFETESASTFSTGIYDYGLTGPGFLESEILNINGSYFYSNDGASQPDPAIRTGTRIRIAAVGQTGNENFRLLIDDQVVAEFTAATSQQSFFHEVDGDVDISQIKIEFTNDLFDPANGIDRNLTVDQVQLIDFAFGDSQLFFVDSPDVFSTGTYNAADGIVAGFGRGDTLHANGFFEFQAETDQAEPQGLGRPTQEVLDEFNQDFPGFFPNFTNQTFTDNAGREFIVAGNSNGTFENILVVRLAEGDDGLADTNFGDNALAAPVLGEHVVPGTGQVVRANPLTAELAFDSNNNIFIVLDVVADNTPRNAPPFNGITVGTEIIKLDSYGQIDTSFGTDGRVFVPFEDGTTVLVSEVAFDSQGRLFINGPQVERNFFQPSFGVSQGIAATDTTLRLDGNRLVEDSSFSFRTDLTTFANVDDFVAANGELTLEDFQTPVATTGGEIRFSGPLNSQTSNQFVSPGDVAPGFTIGNESGELIFDPPQTINGNYESQILNTPAGTIGVIEFDQPVTAVGLDVYSLNNPIFEQEGGIEVRAFGEQGLLNSFNVESTRVGSDNTPAFLGLMADEPSITRIEFEVDGAVWGLDNLRFG